MRAGAGDRILKVHGSDDVADLIRRKDIELLAEPREARASPCSCPPTTGEPEQSRIASV
jgi:hypothetical protein